MSLSSVEEVVVREIQQNPGTKGGGDDQLQKCFCKERDYKFHYSRRTQKSIYYIIIIILIRFVRARERERVEEDEQRAR